MKLLACFVFAFAATVVLGQQVGNYQQENHPPLTYQTCTKSGGCQTQNGAVVIDANWRWLHKVGDYTNCYTGNKWNTQFCPDGKTCAENCALDGAEYESTYGVTTSGSELRLNFVTRTPQGANNIGSRLYLMESDSTYKMFKLKNMEFTFDVDVSSLPCGLNGALYFVEMDADGGMSRFSDNKAGAKYGTGYCDAQCPHDIKFINGMANCEDWQPSPDDPNTGKGKYGTCCNEMDVWESNRVSTALTPHVCTVKGQTQCEGINCGDDPDHRYDGYCDKDGCDFNPYRLGDRTFFGNSSKFQIDTTMPFTVVTQFLTADGTTNTNLTAIKHVWKQNGKVIQTNNVTVGGQKFDSISDDFCNAEKKEFGDVNSYEQRGGNSVMGEAMDHGMVLALSLWDDHAANMLWLDSDYPKNKSPSQPGVARGSCPTTSGVPSEVESKYPNSYVKYSNIKFGELNSTF